MTLKQFFKERSLKADDSRRTKAAELTTRESLYPLALVTVLFFLWGFSYGLLDTLNRHFQVTLNIDQARSTGLQAAYFGCVNSSFYILITPANASPVAHTLLLPLDMPLGFFVTMATELSSSGAFAYMPLEPSFLFHAS